jgi:hypothetical protein
MLGYGSIQVMHCSKAIIACPDVGCRGDYEQVDRRRKRMKPRRLSKQIAEERHHPWEIIA